MRHLGDFGNVHLNSDGLVNITRTDYLANLVGQNSIIGRGLVVSYVFINFEIQISTGLNVSESKSQKQQVKKKTCFCV